MPPIRKTKNFGLIKAIHSGVNPPLNIKMLWYDENPGVRKHKFYDVDSGQWILLSGGSGGSLGTNFVYTAFATEPNGSNFSLTFDNTKEVWAMITSATELQTNELVPSLFDGRWTYFASSEAAGGSGIVDAELDLTSENALQNKKITEMFYLLAPSPNYNSPQVLLSSDKVGTYEVGTNLSVNLSLGFNKNDGGNALNFELNKNNSLLNQSGSVFDYNETITLGEETIDYQATAQYAQGAIKNNPLFGFPDSRGRILAGTDDSPKRRIQGKYLIWFGSFASDPNNSNDVRNDNSLNTEFNGVNEVIINTGTTNDIFGILVPKGINSGSEYVAYDKTNGADLVYSYIKEITINLPTGTKVYEYYKLTTDNPYPSSAEHIITF